MKTETYFETWQMWQDIPFTKSTCTGKCSVLQSRFYQNFILNISAAYEKLGHYILLGSLFPLTLTAFIVHTPKLSFCSSSIFCSIILLKNYSVDALCLNTPRWSYVLTRWSQPLKVCGCSLLRTSCLHNS